MIRTGELLDEPFVRGDDCLRVLGRLGGLIDRGVVARALRVLQFVPAPAQRTELAKTRTELCTSCLLDGVVTALRGRPEAVMSEQRGQRLTG